MRAERQPVPRYRLVSLQLALLVWALVVVARLFWLQVLDHTWLTHRAQLQQQESVTIAAQRGAIFDRNLTPLAMSLPVASLFANPHLIADPRADAAALAPILELNRADLRHTLAEPRSFVWVARKITTDQAQAAEALHLAGIYAQPASRRFYPKGELAASVLGYVGMDGHGLGGIEHSFDAALHGTDGQAVLEVDAHRQSYSEVARPPVEGENLILTIDQNMQFIAQQALDAQVAATHAHGGVAVIENPHTGEILAIANTPTFNPADFQTTSPKRLGDRAISDPYEPGSIFKLITISGALQQGLVTPDEMIDCQNGAIKVGGRIIHDHAPFGVISVTDVLKHSSDVGAIKIGMKLGDQELYHYIEAFGFGRTTGLRLPGESRGIVRPPQRWTPMSVGAVSMGQEVAVTPVQVIALISTFADGGIYHEPRIVLDDFNGDPPARAPAFDPGDGRRVVSPMVAGEMKQMMAQVVLAGTGQKAQLDGYTAAGKTGTAQKVDPGTHLYSTRDFVSSFGGFAPINDPAVAILVVIDSPRGGHEGGDVAGPVFKAIAEQVLAYLGVPHDVPVQAQSPDIHIAPADAVEESEPISDPPEADAEGAPNPAPATAPAEPAAPAPSSPLVVLDYQSASAVVAPDFTGKSVRAVSEACQKLGLDLALQGSGVAQSQSPAPGTHLAPGTRVTVRFAPGSP